MIKSFKCSDTYRLFSRQRVARFQSIEEAARLRLMSINQAISLEELRLPPGNKLEALKGDRKGQYSIRVNKQWRICFKSSGSEAYDIELVDYHV